MHMHKQERDATLQRNEKIIKCFKSVWWSTRKTRIRGVRAPVCINSSFAVYLPQPRERRTNIILFRCQRERAGTFDSILDIVARKKHSPGNRRRGGIPKAGPHTRAPLVSHMSKLGESGWPLRPMARRTFGVARSLERGKSGYPAPKKSPLKCRVQVWGNSNDLDSQRETIRVSLLPNYFLPFSPNRSPRIAYLR